MIDKLVLGTANFGLQYGIANKRKLDKKEVFKILEYAHSQGVWGIDTAKVYGDAEKVIGKFFAEHGKVFNVITKLPNKKYNNAKDIEREIAESLDNMNISHIDFILIHSFETFKRYRKTIIPVLQSLCKDKVIKHFGFSVYHPEEVEDILRDTKDSITIEFPLNLFDQRFFKNNLIQRMKDNGNFLFARSIFLQGLFFLSVEKLKGNFTKVRDKITKIKVIAEEQHIRPECIAIFFAITIPWIDKVILGVDNQKHLIDNINCLTIENQDKYKQISPFLSELEVFDENIILPYKWVV